MIFEAGKDLHVSLLLVGADHTTAVEDVMPEVWMSIAGRDFKQIFFPIVEIGRGWYSFVCPGKYVGGDAAIIVEATGMDALVWRDVYQCSGEMPEELPDAQMSLAADIGELPGDG